MWQIGVGECEPERRLAGSCRHIDIAVGHHDNHGAGLSRGNQVVEYLCGAAEFAPCVLVATHAVEQVEHGVVAPRCLVACGGIDGHAAVGAEPVAVIPRLAHRAVGHIADGIEAVIAAVDKEYVGECRHVAGDVDVRRVVGAHAVNFKGVAVKLRGKGYAGGALPYAVGTFAKLNHGRDAVALVACLEVAGHLHAFGLRIVVAECHHGVIADLRGSKLRPAPQCLLGECRRARQHQC